MFLERIPYVMVLFRFPGIPCDGTLHTRSSDMEPFTTSYCWNYFNGCRSCMDYLFILCSGYTRRGSFHTCDRDRVGFLHNQLRTSHSRHIPYFHMYRPPVQTHDRYVETKLRYVSYAYILARTMGNSIQAHFGITYCCRHSMHCGEYIYLLLCNRENYFAHTGQ